MTTSNELAAAAERVAKCRGQGKSALCEVYQTGNAFDAGASYQDDLATLAYGYLDLGERQQHEETRVFADGCIWNAIAINDQFREDFPDAKLVRVTTFIREVQE